MIYIFSYLVVLPADLGHLKYEKITKNNNGMEKCLISVLLFMITVLNSATKRGVVDKIFGEWTVIIDSDRPCPNMKQVHLYSSCT